MHAWSMVLYYSINNEESLLERKVLSTTLSNHKLFVTFRVKRITLANVEQFASNNILI